MRNTKTMKGIAAAALAVAMVAAPAVQEFSPLFSGTSLGVVANAAEPTVVEINSASDIPTTWDTTNGIKLVLKANVTGDIIIPAGATVEIDLGTFTLTGTGTTVTENGKSVSDTISNKGTLTIKGTGKVLAKTKANSALVNYPGATATIEGGTFEHPDDGAYVVNNMGTMTVNGGTFTAVGAGTPIHNGHNGQNNSSDHGTTSNASKKSTLTINDGTLSGGRYAIKSDDASKVTINDGNFDASSFVIMNYDETTITGGNFTSDSGSAVYALVTSDTTINSGVVKIEGGTFETGTSTIIPSSSTNNGTSDGLGTVTISGGTFKSPILSSNKITVSGVEKEILTDKFVIEGDKVIIEVTDPDMSKNGIDIIKTYFDASAKVTLTTDADDPDAETVKFCNNHTTTATTLEHDKDGHYLVCDNCSGEYHEDSNGNQIAGKELHDWAVVNDSEGNPKVDWVIGADKVPTQATLNVKCSECDETNNEVVTTIVPVTATDIPEAGKSTITYKATFTTGTVGTVECPEKKIVDNVDPADQAAVNDAKTAVEAAAAFEGFTATNDTAESDIKTKVEQILTAAGKTVDTVTISGFNKTNATEENAGSIKFTAVLAKGSETATTSEITLTIAQLTPTATDTAAAKAQPIVNAYLEALTVTEDTTEEAVEKKINALLTGATADVIIIKESDTSYKVSADINGTADSSTATVGAKTKTVETVSSSDVPGDTDGDGKVDIMELNDVVAAYQAGLE